MRNPVQFLAPLRSLFAGGEGSHVGSRLRYATLLLPLFALAVVGSYGLGVKYRKSQHTQKTKPAIINNKDDKAGEGSGLNVSLKELQDRIAEAERPIRWYMNIPKDQLPVIGPPVATQWHTSERLWEKGMVGLYFPEKGEKGQGKDIENESKDDESHKQILLEGMLKDL